MKCKCHDCHVRGQLHAVLWFLQAAWFVTILYLLFYGWNSSASPDEANSAVLATSITMIEIVLAVLAITLGIGAFAGFWMLRTASQEAAREEARKFLNEKGAYLTEEMRTASTGESDALVAAVVSEELLEKKEGE